MLMRTGEVKILDFGVAKAERVLKEGATVVGKIKGKLSYMAPEQLSASKEVDFRADIFSLGCVLWEMLTGEPLFSGHDGGTRSRRLFRGQVPLPSHIRPVLPPKVDGIVLRCCSTCRERATPAAALAEELARWCARRASTPEIWAAGWRLTGSHVQEETVLSPASPPSSVQMRAMPPPRWPRARRRGPRHGQHQAGAAAPRSAQPSPAPRRGRSGWGGAW
jgi:serine/threonine-protein kinase